MKFKEQEYLLKLNKDELDEIKYCLNLELEYFNNLLKQADEISIEKTHYKTKNQYKKSLKESIKYSKEILNKLNKLDNDYSVNEMFIKYS